MEIKESINMGNIIRSSSKALTVTGKNFVELRQQITDIHNQRLELNKRIRSAKSKYSVLRFTNLISYILIFGFFYKKIKTAKESQQKIIEDLEGQRAENYVKLTFADKSQIEKSWLNCLDAYEQLMNVKKIWDLTYTEGINRVAMRTIADTSIKRSLITNREAKSIDIIKSDLDHMFLPNLNGADIFIYPTFMVLYKDNQKFGIFDLKEIKATFEFTGYIEEESVPEDAEIINHTWKKANKDGSMDKRFSGNHQIPVVKYGKLMFQSDDGLEEGYMFSDPDSFNEFAQAYDNYIALIKKK